MKLSVNLFILLAFTIFKTLVLSTSLTNLIVPNPNEVTFIKTTDFKAIPSCDALVFCLNIVGAAISNIAFGIVFVLQILFNIVVFLVEIVALFAQVSIATIPGIPTWLNLLLFTVPSVMIIIALIQLFKPSSGEE